MTIDWANFTPYSALAGGALLGIAVIILWLCNGRIAGISGILGGLLPPKAGDISWRVAFTLGLIAAPVIYSLFAALPVIQIDAGLPVLIVAGLLVGIGTRYGAGCTSGHGVCGLARFSPRSLLATLSFMFAGFVTVWLVRHLFA
ncbi:sulfur transport family protein [Yersinia rochesterensis]|uniref:Sulfur transport family protein n=1 Tax=Yersinia rochesterensis TaxID=1604335 RepID=A0A386HGY5_9GAMM|nr:MULTISPECIES: YeeE/YedE family protein [Yersinia]AJI88579.1 sulfur transport family protein [Yersinia frederiksenii Y225]CNI01684.1 putative transmembrane protein [Yersinia kristensenii]AIN17199.1 sulfur transport family protein [Yersinia rochesterensis]AJJ34335.1 sulfur transport family protein [Yersinia rochesterensis]AYD45117.1 YeeE/YedE family protein [Yersinia rochesterensis]